jgi:hypothetical protein
MKLRIEKNVICHIVGLTPSFREKIKLKFQGNPEVELIDLDAKAEELKYDKKMEYLYHQWELFKEKNNEKFKSIEKEMDLYWHNSLSDFINDNIKKYNDKRLIFIGENNHFRHLSKKVDIPTGNKFYLNIDDKNLCHDVIKGFLTSYHDDIIKGSFPLSFLDHKFLIERRKRTNKMFNNWDYQNKNEEEIFEFLELSLNQKKMELLNHLYYATKMPYYSGAEIHPDKDKSLIAFSNPWDALFTLIPPKSNVSSGVKKGEPFIKEELKKAFEKLKFKAYLYQLDKTTFIPINKKDSSKFRSTLPAKILKKEKFHSLTSVCRKHNIDTIKLD